MTNQLQNELDQKIKSIQFENVSDGEKSHRIKQVKIHYENIAKNERDAAAKKQADVEANLKSRLKSAYMQNPVATEDDFEADYPRMKSEHLRAEAVKRDTEASEQMTRSMWQKF